MAGDPAEAGVVRRRLVEDRERDHAACLVRDAQAGTCWKSPPSSCPSLTARCRPGGSPRHGWRTPGFGDELRRISWRSIPAPCECPIRTMPRPPLSWRGTRATPRARRRRRSCPPSAAARACREDRGDRELAVDGREHPAVLREPGGLIARDRDHLVVLVLVGVRRRLAADGRVDVEAVDRRVGGQRRVLHARGTVVRVDGRLLALAARVRLVAGRQSQTTSAPATLGVAARATPATIRISTSRATTRDIVTCA